MVALRLAPVSGSVRNATTPRRAGTDRYLRFARSDLDQRLQARVNGKLQEVDLKPILTSNDDGLLLRAVRSGRGLCVFPDYLVEKHVRNGSLQLLLPTAEIQSAFGSTVYAIFARHRMLPARIRVFLEHLKSGGTRQKVSEPFAAHVLRKRG